MMAVGNGWVGFCALKRQYLFCYEIIKVLIAHEVFEAKIYIADITMHVVIITMVNGA